MKVYVIVETDYFGGMEPCASVVFASLDKGIAIKEFKNPTINYKKLQKSVTAQVKLVKPDIF